MALGEKDSQPFLGKEFGHQPDYSGQVAYQIDEEVRHLLDEAHDEALEILVENDHVLESVASKLLEVETVDRDLLTELFEPINKRPNRALSAPEADDPKTVLRKLRRLDASANGSGNGHQASKKTAKKSTGKRASKKQTSAPTRQDGE
jgi:cell division protease FtsH